MMATFAEPGLLQSYLVLCHQDHCHDHHRGTEEREDIPMETDLMRMMTEG